MERSTEEVCCVYFGLLFSETLSVLARAVGKEVFMPLAAESLQLGLKLIADHDDPDLRRCV